MTDQGRTQDFSEGGYMPCLVLDNDLFQDMVTAAPLKKDVMLRCAIFFLAPGSQMELG